VKRVVAAYRGLISSAGNIDFARQIPQLSEPNDINLLARAAAEEGPEPSRSRVEQIIHALEEAHLKRRAESLQQEIQKAEVEKRPREEIDSLSRDKREIGRRIQELKPSRKGKELAD
jgi:hypothetical protein